MDIATWLHGLGLQQYESAFRENAIDATLLPELTAEDLRDIGVNLVGHRRKLLAAISSLRSGVASGSAASPTSGERRRLVIRQGLGGLAGDDGAGAAAIEHEADDGLAAEDPGFVDQPQDLAGCPSIEG